MLFTFDYSRRPLTLNLIIRLTAGLILIAAGTLKIQAGLTVPTPVNFLTFQFPLWANFSLAAFELLLGTSLIIGIAAEFTRITSICLFSIFCIYNIVEMASGSPHCNCLGVLRVPPLYMMIIDASVILALLYCKTSDREIANFTLTSNRILIVATTFISLTVFSSTAILWFQIQELDSSGLLVAKSAEHDFGQMPPNTSMTHVFKLLNDSADTLVVARVHANCGCTTSEVPSGTTIKPGESIDLPVTMNTGMDEGYRFADVFVFYHPISSQLFTSTKVRVSVTTQADYSISHQLIDFGIITGIGANEIVKKLSLIKQRQSDFKVLSAKVISSAFRTRIIEPMDNTSTWDIDVVFCPQSDPVSSSYTSRLVLTTNSLSTPVIHIPIVARYEPSVNVHPSALVIGANEQGEICKKVTITTSNASAIHKLYSDNTQIRVQLLKTVRNQSHDLLITFPEELQSVHTTVHVWLIESGSLSVNEVSITVARLPSH